MQSGAGAAIGLDDDAFDDVAFIADRSELVKDADVVLCVQPPALEVVDAMKEGAILVCFVYADNEPALVKRLLARKITCFAMERVPRITRAQAMDALSSQSALAGYYAVALGMTHLARVLPKITSAAGVDRPGQGAGDGAGRRRPGSHGHGAPARRRGRRLRRAARDRRNRRCRWARPSSIPASMRPARAAMRANSLPRKRPRSPTC